jgi:hypothetical protein
VAERYQTTADCSPHFADSANAYFHNLPVFDVVVKRVDEED